MKYWLIVHLKDVLHAIRSDRFVQFSGFLVHELQRIWKRMWYEVLEEEEERDRMGTGAKRTFATMVCSLYIVVYTHIDIGHAWQDAWLATPVKTRKTRRIQTRLVPFAPFQDSPLCLLAFCFRFFATDSGTMSNNPRRSPLRKKKVHSLKEELLVKEKRRRRKGALCRIRVYIM